MACSPVAHRYWTAYERQGRHPAACRLSAAGVAGRPSPFAAARTPRSPGTKASGSPSPRIAIISTVQAPRPGSAASPARARAQSLPALRSTDPLASALASAAKLARRAAGNASVAGSAAASAAQALAAAHARAAARAEEASQVLESLEEERRRLEAGETATPPAPHTRGEGVRDRRSGAPLWRLTDFAGSLDERQRAGLEAALEASGLLDAWVTPDGTLLDPGTHDVVVTAAAPAGNGGALRHDGPPTTVADRSLAGLLRPTIDEDAAAASHVSPHIVQAILTAIGLSGPDDEPPRSAVWVSVSGRWQVGPLRGAWAKPAAEYVGAGAREQARRRRLASLAGEITVAHDALAAARRAVQVTGTPPAMTDPVLIELVPPANIAVGTVPWGLSAWAAADAVQRISTGADARQAAAAISAALALASHRPLIVVVRDAHRYPVARALVTCVLEARPDAVVVEMGLPVWRPPAGAHIATYGAAHTNAQAAAELLGLTPG